MFPLHFRLLLTNILLRFPFHRTPSHPLAKENEKSMGESLEKLQNEEIRLKQESTTLQDIVQQVTDELSKYNREIETRREKMKRYESDKQVIQTEIDSKTSALNEEQDSLTRVQRELHERKTEHEKTVQFTVSKSIDHRLDEVLIL